MVLVTLLSTLTSSVSLFVAAILISFLGLNETKRWSYKTNLTLCVICAVTGSIVGVFTWFEVTSIFILLFLVGGFMLYYREASLKLYPAIKDFSLLIGKSDNLSEIVEEASIYLKNLIDGAEVFIVLSDGNGGLYLPETQTEERLELKRNGSLVWKTYASEKTYITKIIKISQDKPLWCDANSIVSIPLLTTRSKIGVLQIESDKINVFAEEDLPKLEIFAFILSQRLYCVLNNPTDTSEIRG